MKRKQSHEPAQQLVQSFQETTQTIVESAVAVQERNMQFAQRLYYDWLAALEDHSQNLRTLAEKMEQQARKQQDAYQQLVQESMSSYLDSLTAGFAFFAPTLRLNEKLQFCLLALASRYPHHHLTINEEVLGPQKLGAEGWRAHDLIELFQNTSPQLLQANARLEVTAQRKGIYLLERSEEVPAFWVFCGELGEKITPYQGNMGARQAEHAQRPDKAQGGHVPVGELQTAG